MSRQVSLSIIGVVRSPVLDERDDGWGEVESRIEIDPAFARGIEGLGDFSHALVVFLMHRADFVAERDLRRHPRGRSDLPEVGIFAQRAKHRPSPIGVTAVEIVGVDDDGVRVRGLDAIDGTPVLDIKPYVEAFDRRDETRRPRWIDEIMREYFTREP